MKTPKLLKKAEAMLSARKSAQRGQKDNLKEILRKLKHRKRKLKERLKTEKSQDDLERIRKDLAIIHAQRKKGLKILKTLK